MKIVFMGTPEFALSSLNELINSKHDIVAVFTQPDKPKGRSKKLQSSPVKEIALENGIKIFQPERLRNADSIAEIANLAPDLIVVAAYGQILPKKVLEIPRYGAINVHASILPKYRGAAPINYAIMNGEVETGVTIMKMDVGLDTGDIIKIEKTTIFKSDTDQTVSKRLAEIGGKVLIEVINDIEKNDFIASIPQDDSKSTYASMMDKSLGYINFNNDAEKIDYLIRAITVWPTATCMLNKKKIKIYMSHIKEEETDIAYDPGTVVEVTKESLGIATERGILYFDEVQLEGKKRMDIKNFLLGNKLNIGDKFETIV